jgi:hypothetical protein
MSKKAKKSSGKKLDGAALLAAYKGGATLPELGAKYGRRPQSIRGTLVRAAGGVKEWAAIVKTQVAARTKVREREAKAEAKAEEKKEAAAA